MHIRVKLARDWVMSRRNLGHERAMTMIGPTRWAETDDHDPVASFLAEFEADWRSGQRPRIEDYLRQTDQALAGRLFEALLVSELLHRERLGESPEPEEYRGRFSNFEPSIAPGFEQARLEASGRSWNLGTEVEVEVEVKAEVKGMYSTVEQGQREPSRGPSGGHDTQGCRYEKLREHAQGNLGKIFVARDTELNREVALKEIQARHADRVDSRLRFVLEGEVTGRLDHPGIVPVHGLGHYPDGRPFYAMRFVRGETLKEAIRRARGDRSSRSNASLRGLVGRLVDAAQAIAYAHSRGILHRDIKPDNILLGPFGETLVVDWGLAMPIARSEGDVRAAEGTLEPSSEAGSAHDRTGSVLGTPVYMSPEQAAGEIDQLGPRSDVYGLGATLYCILTGRPPFLGSDVRTILKAVQAGDFAHPRSLRPDIPRPLAAICLKALALRPIDRYAGARELAADLQNWLDDEPILAHREPWLVRVARWTRRNQPIVAGAVAVGVSTIIGLAIHDRMVARDRVRTEANFQQILSTLQFVLQEIAATDLAYLPGGETVRIRLAEHCIGDLDHFLRDRPGDLYLRSLLADAHRELGNIERLTGQWIAPETHYRLAIGYLDELIKESREPHVLRNRLVAVMIDFGELMRLNGKLTRAEAQFRQALAMTETDIARFPFDSKIRRNRAMAILDLAAVQTERGEHEEARSLARAAIDQFSALIEGQESIDLDPIFLVTGLTVQGTNSAELGDWKAAHATLDEAIERAGNLKSQHGRYVNNRSIRAMAFHERGRLWTKERSQPAAAMPDQEAAIELLTSLTTGPTTIPMYRAAIARCQIALAASLLDSGEPVMATRHCEQARQTFADLMRLRLKPEYQNGMGEALGNLGRAKLKVGQRAEAIVLFNQALDIQRIAKQGRPLHKDDQALIERHQADLAQAESTPER